MDFLGKTCPVCSQNFHEGDDVVVCPKCGAPYHRDCFKQKGKCIFPELHKDGKSWKDIYDDDPTENNDVVKCISCGTDNDKNAIVCKNCGAFISRNVSVNINENTSDEKDSHINDENFENYIPGMSGNPFSVFIDPMGGVSKDDDFDGVSGAEISKYVGVNTQYYLPVFAKIKNIGKSKFNLSAFLFSGAWFLFRKRYLIGIIISILFFITELSSVFLVSAYSAPIYKEAENAFKEVNIQYPMIGNYISFAYEHYSAAGVFWAVLPYILIAVRLFIAVFSGFTANKIYYRTSVKNIKLIKSKNHDGDTMKAVAEAGGTNAAAAWVFIICYAILSIASLFV